MIWSDLKPGDGVLGSHNYVIILLVIDIDPYGIEWLSLDNGERFRDGRGIHGAIEGYTVLRNEEK